MIGAVVQGNLDVHNRITGKNTVFHCSSETFLYGRNILFGYITALNLSDELQITLKVVIHLYPNMRHEVLNEEKKQEVYDDVLRFLEEGK